MGKNNKKYTLEEVREIVGDKGYELVSEEYVNAHQKLILKDINGYYYISTMNALQQLQKPDIVNKSNPYSIQNIKLFLLHNNNRFTLVTKKYMSAKTELILKDIEGYMYTTTWDNLKHFSFPRLIDKSNKYSIYNINLWLSLKNKTFIMLSNNYTGTFDKLKFKCLIDNEDFELSWSDLRNGCNCPYCSGQRTGLSNCLTTKNPELAKEWHPTLNGDLTPYDVTCGSTKDVWWICGKGHEWNASVSERNRGNGCPYCAGKYPTNDYNLLVINPELCEEWDYYKNDKNPDKYLPNANKYTHWVCKECGWKWEALISNRNGNKSSGCPKCSESKGEKKLDVILTKHNISHGSQYKFDDLIGTGGGLLKFDVPIFWDKNKTLLRMLIEYDGKQHFEWVKGMMTKKEFETLKIHDKLKDEYCKSNNINLLRISYWDFDNIEEILIRELNINKTNNSEKHCYFFIIKNQK